jgi:hypothetical protein
MTTTVSKLGVPEDKLILQERTRLERYWYNNLTDTQRELWNAYLDDNPPTDFAGHIYVITVPTAQNEILVNEAVRYAWSQIFATLRFGLAPVDEPVALTLPNLLLANLTITETTATVDVDQDPRTIAGLRVLLYATPAIDPITNVPWSIFRPLCFPYLTSFPSVRDFRTCYIFRYAVPPPTDFALSGGFVDPNNQFQRSTIVLTTW